MTKTTIRYFGTEREHNKIMPSLIDCAMKTLSSGKSLQGKEVGDLEDLVKTTVNRRYAVAVGSCTDALYYSLLSIGIGHDDEVIVPAFSFIATASCILRAGAKPVFCDVDQNGNATLRSIQNLVTKRTKAIIYVHMYGYFARRIFDEIAGFCREQDIPLIEDAAQAFGAYDGGRAVGKGGVISCISFDPTKVISAPGSGGLILTDSEEISERCKRLRYHGKSNSGEFIELGFNSQMSTFTASVLLLKLTFNSAWLKKRVRIAERYVASLADLPLLMPPTPSFGAHVYHKFVIRSSDREGLKVHLGRHGVETMIHYPVPLPDLPIFKSRSLKRDDLSGAAQIADEVLSLPCHPHLEDDEIAHVIETVSKFFETQ
jgi:dTDP-4-amino-4,6-dideoxygalactose transaminase